MISQPPDELKLIRPYIHRGNQMEKMDPVITYYCYYWAVRLALEKGLHNASPECTAFVSTLMEDLEGRKEALKGDDRLDDDMAARAYVENFASKVFDNGAKAIEMGKATEKTPETLQAAAVFLELTKIFTEELEPEVARKIKYVKFHAARILKALKEGSDLNPPAPEPETRAPQLPPPPPTLEEVPDESFDLAPRISEPPPHNEAPRSFEIPDVLMTSPSPVIQVPSSPPFASLPLRSFPPTQEPVSPDEAPSHASYFPPVQKVHEPSPGLSPITLVPTNTTFPDMGYDHIYRDPSPPMSSITAAPQYQPTHFTPQPVHYQQQVHAHIPPPPAVRRKELKEEDFVQAQKYAKWAISALDYEDVDNAILQFRSALATLGAAP
ncbi:Vta1 like-domain-containing protein [Trichophaea hybrida]|nr:Vta1 like-domain-containing protein [Trichophaea hybrida]